MTYIDAHLKLARMSFSKLCSNMGMCAVIDWCVQKKGHHCCSLASLVSDIVALMLFVFYAQDGEATFHCAPKAARTLVAKPFVAVVCFHVFPIHIFLVRYLHKRSIINFV